MDGIQSRILYFPSRLEHRKVQGNINRTNNFIKSKPVLDRHINSLDIA